MALPFSGSAPAVFAERIWIAKQTGIQAVALVKKSIKPRDIMTKAAFENAIAADMALGGSTNTALHIPAIAYYAEVDITLKDFGAFTEKVPHLTSLVPAGPHHVSDLYYAGGIPAIMAELSKAHLGRSSGHDRLCQAPGENAEGNQGRNKGPRRDPDGSKSGACQGGPGGFERKSGAVGRRRGSRRRFRGDAEAQRPGPDFHSEEEAFQAIVRGRVRKKDVVVVRYEGPKGGPGCRRCSPDGGVGRNGPGQRGGADHRRAVFRRQPRGRHRTCLPGSRRERPDCRAPGRDIIEIDITRKTLNFRLSQAEVKRRLSALPKFEPKIKSAIWAGMPNWFPVPTRARCFRGEKTDARSRIQNLKYSIFPSGCCAAVRAGSSGPAAFIEPFVGEAAAGRESGVFRPLNELLVGVAQLAEKCCITALIGVMLFGLAPEGAFDDLLQVG